MNRRNAINCFTHFVVIWAAPCAKTFFFFFRVDADREGPDQPAHPCSLIKTVTVHYKILRNV